MTDASASVFSPGAILVPVDGSENAARAARFAITLAGRLEVPVRLLHIFGTSGPEVMGLASLSREEIEAGVARSARRIFDEVRAALEADQALPAVEVTELTRMGDPASEILQLAAAEPGIHVVMGRRGRSPIQSLLLGSVSDKVLRHAAGPVTVVT